MECMGRPRMRGPPCAFALLKLCPTQAAHSNENDSSGRMIAQQQLVSRRKCLHFHDPFPARFSCLRICVSAPVLSSCPPVHFREPACRISWPNVLPVHMLTCLDARPALAFLFTKPYRLCQFCSSTSHGLDCPQPETPMVAVYRGGRWRHGNLALAATPSHVRRRNR